MATPNINPRADGEGQFGESALRWLWIYADNIDGRQIYEGGVRVATLASPTFTGTPSVPTPSASDDSTKIASTAFVQAELTDNKFIASLAGAWTSGEIAIAGIDGVANTTGVTTTSLLARANHTGTQAQSTIVNLGSDLALLSPIASPTFTGTPAAPTASPDDNSTQIATTAYADAAAAAIDVSGVGANTTNIATNTTNIGTPAGTSNAADIALNTAAIATNVTNIGTPAGTSNAADIATNLASITELEKGAFSVNSTVADAGSKSLANSDLGSMIILGSASTLSLDAVTQIGSVLLIDTGATASELTWSTSTVLDAQGSALTSPHTLNSNALLSQKAGAGGVYYLQEYVATHTHPQSDITDLVADLTALQDADSDYEIVVKQASDLSGTLVSDKVYVIDGVVDMGTQTITVPSGGLEIKGHGVNTSKLLSSEAAYTMFIDAASDAGNTFLSDVAIEVSGAGSQVFDLDNSGAGGSIELTSINFENCSSLGLLDAYRQFVLMNGFWNNCDDGITFAGTWAGGAFIDALLIRNFDPLAAGGTVFTGSTSPALTFGSRFFCNANIAIPAGATIYDFEASMFTSDADFELITGEYTGAGTVVAVKSPVIDNTSTKSRFRDNNGLANTYVGGRWYIDTGDAVDTTIATIDVYVKAAGTTTEEDLQWMSSAGDNDLTYTSTQDAKIQIAGSINVSAASGGSDKNISLTLRHWDDSAGVYIDLPNKAKGISTSATAFHNIAIIGYATVSENDRIELWIENNTDTVNLAVDEGSLLSISERAN